MGYVEICVLLLVLLEASVITRADVDSTSNDTTVLIKHGPRIVGGQPAVIGQIPYQALIKAYTNTGIFLCGGSIVTHRHVLTAAHCVEGVAASGLEVMAGEINRQLSTGWFQTRVSYVHIHDQYRSERYYNDIAVLETILSFPLDGYFISSVKLRDVPVVPGTPCTVSGWGSTKERGPSSNTLQFALIPIVEKEVCSYNLRKQLLDGEICAGYASGGKDACQGDSGGPLTCEGYLTGVVSWGKGCARVNTPGVYADVVYYKRWIEAIISNRYDETPGIVPNIFDSNDPAPDNNGRATTMPTDTSYKSNNAPRDILLNYALLFGNVLIYVYL